MSDERKWNVRIFWAGAENVGADPVVRHDDVVGIEFEDGVLSFWTDASKKNRVITTLPYYVEVIAN